MKRKAGAEGGRFDYDFEQWWKASTNEYPNVSRDDALQIWTSGYADGYDWGQEVATPANY